MLALEVSSEPVPLPVPSPEALRYRKGWVGGMMRVERDSSVGCGGVDA